MVSVIDGSEPIRSMDDFKRKYFPKQHEQEKFDAMTPEEQGKELARRAMEKCSLSKIDIRQDPTGRREAMKEELNGILAGLKDFCEGRYKHFKNDEEMEEYLMSL